MTPHLHFTRRLWLTGLSLLLVATQLVSVHAAELRVITSGAFTEAYKQLVPEFEKQTGHRVVSAYGAFIGNAPDSIPSRFARGEKFDLVILSEGGLEALIKSGNVIPGSRVDLVRSQPVARICPPSCSPNSAWLSNSKTRPKRS